MPLNNRIEDLHPTLAAVYAEAKADYHEENPKAPRVELNETHRSLEVQRAYYAQGRESLAEINRLRKLAGLYLLKADEAARKVTNSLPGSSRHSSLPSEAFDVRMIDRATGKATWDVKWFNLFAKYVQAAANKLDKKVSSGALWTKFPDPPHHELTR